MDKEDLESILDDCLALSFPELHLKWHYRSRHESLITFSNVNYYDNSLYTFPSPNNLVSKVQFVQVPGYYDRGGTRQNFSEGKAVVEDIIRRLHGKFIDNLFITRDGKIILVEDKLLRNESSRRVIAQTIDYAQDLQKWSYEDFDSEFLLQKMNKDKLGLYDFINRQSGGSVDKVDFIRAIEKNLASASFLILIVGDKIHSDTEYMASFLNQHTTMNFQIGLIEMEVYITNDNDWLVIPYLTTKTVTIDKLYVRVFSQEGKEDFVKETKNYEQPAVAVGISENKTGTGIAALSDEELYSLIEQNGSLDIREGIQEIIDDINNNQLTGYFIKRKPKTFCIYLQNAKLARSISIMTIYGTEARFDKNVFLAVLKDSDLESEKAEKLLSNYLNYLENTLGFSGKYEVALKSLFPIVKNKIGLIAEFRRLATEIDEAMVK